MKQHGFALLGLGFVLGMIFFRVLFLGHTFYFGDNTTLFLPIKTLASQSYRAGNLPVWNPYSLSGTPLLADAANGVLSPFMALFVLLPPARALALSIVLAFWIAAAGVYFLVWWRSKNWHAAILAALVWALSGTLMERTSNLTIIETLAFLPWVFAFTQAFINTERRMWLLPAAIALALSIYAGYLPLVVLFFLVWMVWMVAERRFEAIPIVGGLGVGLAGLQLLPFLELYFQSTRFHFKVAGLPGEQLSLLQLPRLVLAWFYGVKTAGSSWGIGAPPETGWASSDGYVGVIPLMIVVSTLAFLRKRALFWLTLSGFSLWLALGTHTFLGQVWQGIPVLSGIRPYHWLAVFTFAVAVLVGEGFTDVVKKKIRIEWWASVVAAIGAVGWLITPLITSFLLQHFNSAHYPFSKLEVIIHTLSLNVLWVGVILHLWQWRQRFGMWCLVLAVIIDCVVLSRASLFTAPDSWYEGATPLTTQLAASFDHNYRFISWAGTDPYSDFDPLFNQLTVREPFYPSMMSRDENQNLLILRRKLQDLPPNGNVPLQLPSVTGYVGMVPVTTGSWWGEGGLNKIPVSLADTVRLSQSSVKYALIVAPQPILQGWRVVATDGYRAVLANDQALPRAYVMGSAGIEPATIIEENSTRVVITVSSKTGGQLVLTDSYYPGWNVVVDGAGSLITPYQNAWRQVTVPAGEHTVVFSYRSPVISAGKWLSAGSLLLSLVLVMIFWEEKRAKSK